MSIIDAMNSLRNSQGRASTTSTVVVEADMTQYHKNIMKAKKDLAKFDKKLEASRQKAASTGKGGFFGRLGKKVGISGEGFTFGAAKMGSEGFQFETGAFLSASRTALIGVAVTRTGAAVLSGVNKFNKMRREGVDFAEAGLRVGRDSLGRIGRQVSDATGAVKLMSNLGELLGGGDAESNEKAIFKFYSDAFTTQKEMEEAEKRRRDFVAEKTDDADEFLALQLKQINESRPIGFIARTSNDLAKYRAETRKINRASQAIKRDILIEQAEQQSKTLETEGT